MKAIVQDRYGSTDTLALAEIEKPTIGEGEVLVRVRAAGVDQGVWHLMAGMPYLVRYGFGLRAPKVAVRGRRSRARWSRSARASRARPGDEVYGTGEGSFAEYAAADQGSGRPQADEPELRQAAAVPISA